MLDSQFANANGSVSTTSVAAESQEQQTNKPEMKLYEVSVAADLQLCLTGSVNVYAADAAEAAEKVQAKIDHEMLNDDMEMEDCESGYTMPYSHVKNVCNVAFEIDGVEVVEDDVDPFNVLKADVQHLQAHVSWNSEALTKHKAFLESLLTKKVAA